MNCSAKYDQKLAKIGSIREQVYADWYKYMLASYATTTTTRLLRCRENNNTVTTNPRTDSNK
ncbi:MAG UNVERIFIED_CONTAM: hypothetical protein LVR29_06680 [Microcystis novacekii LVE1205-3]